MAGFWKKLKDTFHLRKKKRRRSSSSSSSDDESDKKGAVRSLLDPEDSSFRCALKDRCREGDFKKRPSGSRQVSYKKKLWHETCFSCVTCKRDFSSTACLYKEKNFYCQSCYHDKFAPKCRTCSKNITNEVLEYDGHSYHNDCLVCVACNLTIADKKFFKHDGNLVCSGCFSIHYAKRCHSCSKAIMSDKVLEYDGRSYHNDCLVCQTCKRTLASKKFMKHGGSLACIDCFSSHYAKRCHSCNKPIINDVIFFENKNWHKECFVCKSCNTCLAGNTFMKSGDDIKCEKCAR